MGRTLAAIFIIGVVLAGAFIAVDDILTPSPRMEAVQAVQEEQLQPVLGETSGYPYF